MISILGCGWFGLPLGRSLVKDGLMVKGSTTTASRSGELESAGIKPFIVDLMPERADIDNDFFECDMLIIAIPPKIRNGEHDQYLFKIENVIQSIVKYKISKVLYISSTGVYPDVNDTVTELTDIEPNSASTRTLLAAENLFRQNTAFKTAIIRFGGLIGPNRHPGRFFGGKRDVPNGKAPVNLIHLHDCIGIAKAVINKNAFGHTFNASLPHHPQKQLFYSKAAEHAGLPRPLFVDELKEWKIVQSINIPSVLNYHFQYGDWDECFAYNDSF